MVDLDAVCDVITAGTAGCAGQALYLAFTGVTDCINNTSGWFLDDVEVTADIPAACSAVPDPVSFFTATSTSTQNELEWLNSPTSGSTVIVYRTDRLPTTPTDGTQLSPPVGTLNMPQSFLHTGLTNTTTYYYGIFADSGGSFSVGKFTTGRPQDTSGAVKWVYITGATAMAPPGIAVYAVSNDRVLHSMAPGAAGGDWPSGWIPFALNQPAQSRPPVVGVSVGGASKVTFLGSQDGRVYAVDADTGSQVWASPSLGAMVQAAPAGMFSIFGGAFDLILIGTRDATAANSFYGLNLADGTVAWTFSNSSAEGGDDLTMGIVNGGASVDYANNRLHFASFQASGGSQNTVWCLDFNGTSATLRWARNLGNVSGSPIRHGGKVYVGTDGSTVHALDADTGADLWTVPFNLNDGPVKGFIWPDFASSDLYLTTTGRVWSLTDTGTSASENWNLATIPAPSIPLFTLNGNRLMVGSGDGNLYEIDVSAPLTPKSVTLGDGSAAVGSPSLHVWTGILYVGTDAGAIYAVQIPLP